MKYREFAKAIPSNSTLEYGMNLATSLTAVATKKDAFTDNACVSLMPLPDGTVLAMSGEKSVQETGFQCILHICQEHFVVCAEFERPHTRENVKKDKSCQSTSMPK